MTRKEKSFLLGFLVALLGHGIREPEVERSFRFDPERGLLIIYQDDGNLRYHFDQQRFRLTVTEV